CVALPNGRSYRGFRRLERRGCLRSGMGRRPWHRIGRRMAAGSRDSSGLRWDACLRDDAAKPLLPVGGLDSISSIAYLVQHRGAGHVGGRPFSASRQANGAAVVSLRGGIYHGPCGGAGLLGDGRRTAELLVPPPHCQRKAASAGTLPPTEWLLVNGV